MLYTPLLPDVAGGLVDARFVTIPLANTLHGVRAVRGRVDSVDFDGHTVTYTDPEQRSRSLSWDRLVLTPGSVTRLFDIPGLAEYARGLKSTAEAVYLRDHMLEQLELANIDDDEDRIRARRTIVVVGASYSGTELVVQLRALADTAAEADGLRPRRREVRAARHGRAGDAGGGREAGRACQRVLRQRGIDVRLGMTLKEVHSEHVVLSDDSRIDTHTVAWVTGVTGAPLIEKLGLADRARPAEGAGRPAGARPPRCVRRRRRGRGARPDAARQDHAADRAARDSAGKGAGPQRRRQPGVRQAQGVQAPQHGPGRRPRPALRGRQSTEHPTVRVRREAGDSDVPPVRHARASSTAGRCRWRI